MVCVCLVQAPTCRDNPNEAFSVSVSSLQEKCGALIKITIKGSGY